MPATPSTFGRRYRILRRWPTRRLATALASALALVALPVTATAEAPSAPGAVVATEPLPASQGLPGAAASTKVTYWTADSRDRPRLSSGAIFVPEGTPPPGGWPTISWGHGSNGLGDQCAPTVVGRPAPESSYLADLLADGFAVVASDYIGLGTEGLPNYLDSGGEAHAMIDIVRAARGLYPAIGSVWLAQGHSQGAHAALNTAPRAERYAPELDYRGTVATSAPPQIDALVGLIGPQMPRIPAPASLFVMAIAGFRDLRPDLDVDSHLTDLGRRTVALAETLCSPQLDEQTANLSIGELVAQPLGELTAPFQDYLRLPVAGYHGPLFLGHGTRDEILPYPLVFTLLTGLLLHGVAVDFHSYDAGHDSIIPIAAADVRAFLAAAVD
ncbi:lipase family protein [Nocardia sp. NPDC050710]|uniref:lipase family protein n=1 Tax=Nocardia sp. NPDC050710 TaxID=3157220 RepID=UPI0033FD4DFD